MTFVWGIVLTAVALGWLAGNAAGWWLTKPGPFNWRVFISPDRYYAWLDTQP